MATKKITARSARTQVQVVVAEGSVKLEDLHKALDQAVREITKGGCNCGLTGFDLTFIGGDPALNKSLAGIANVKGGIVAG